MSDEKMTLKEATLRLRHRAARVHRLVELDAPPSVIECELDLIEHALSAARADLEVDRVEKARWQLIREGLRS